jgi:hypothetical protein
MTTRNCRIKSVRSGTCGIIGGCKYVPSTLTISQYLDVGTTSWTAPAFVRSVEYLIVGGGGGSGGGFDTGGGGGGGGGMVLTGTFSVTPGITYTVTVGDGGASGVSIRDPVSEINGLSGDDSIFGNITALGGGGGYASRYTSGVSSSGGISVSGLTASTGGSGGGSAGDANGAGGGGSSGNGANGVANVGGNGGAGTASSISGSATTYGTGGGGANGNSTNAPVAGVVNTGDGARGGGGASGQQQNGAKGGSGIVIIQYYA